MRIIKKPNIINQECKVCGTQVEITHKEVKRKAWKCPFCNTKNEVTFEKPTKKVEVVKKDPRCTVLTKYTKSNPAKIKIVNYKSYDVTPLSEESATKLFELILNGFNTPQRLSSSTGLKQSSIVRYCAILKGAKLINGTPSTGYHTNSHVVIQRKSWRV